MKSKITKASRVLLLFVMLMTAALPAAAEKFTGKVGGKYPVVVYIDINRNGDYVSGRYAYRSTLKKYGDKPSSWLYISGYATGFSAKGATYECTVTDSNGKYVENWVLDYYTWDVSAEITTKAGKSYTLNLR